jgi:hypothetical protein
VSCLVAVVVVVTSWHAHQVVSQVTQLAKGISTGSAPSVGAMNVLVMGLESRTDYHGNVLLTRAAGRDARRQVLSHRGRR